MGEDFFEDSWHKAACFGSQIFSEDAVGLAGPGRTITHAGDAAAFQKPLDSFPPNSRVQLFILVVVLNDCIELVSEDFISVLAYYLGLTDDSAAECIELFEGDGIGCEGLSEVGLGPADDFEVAHKINGTTAA